MSTPENSGYLFITILDILTRRSDKFLNLERWEGLPLSYFHSSHMAVQREWTLLENAIWD